MKRPDGVAVTQSKQSDRVEYGRLSDLASAVFSRYCELQSGMTRKSHFRVQTQFALGVNFFDSPAIQRVADVEFHRMTPTTSEPGTADQHI